MRYIVWLVGNRLDASEVYNHIGAVEHMMDGNGAGGLHSAYLESDHTQEEVVGMVDQTLLEFGDRVRRDSVWHAGREAGMNRRERIHYDPHMFDGTPVVRPAETAPSRNYDMDSEEDVLA